MKNFILSAAVFALLSTAVMAQAPAANAGPVKPKSILDIKGDIESSPQKKNFTLMYDEKTDKSFVRTTYFILGRQQVAIDGGGDQPQMVTIPSWQISVSIGFDTMNLARSPDEYVWSFKIYDQMISVDSGLSLKLDDEELTIKPFKSGRSTNSDLALSGDRSFQMDQTQNNIRDNLGNLPQKARPTVFMFSVSGPTMEKLLSAQKAKISVGKQYSASLPKGYAETLKTLVAVTSVK